MSSTLGWSVKSETTSATAPEHVITKSLQRLLWPHFHEDPRSRLVESFALA